MLCALCTEYRHAAILSACAASIKNAMELLPFFDVHLVIVVGMEIHLPIHGARLLVIDKVWVYCNTAMSLS